MRAPPDNVLLTQRPHLQIPPCWGLGFQHMAFDGGRHKHRVQGTGHILPSANPRSPSPCIEPNSGVPTPTDFVSLHDQATATRPASPVDTNLSYHLAPFLFQPNQLTSDTCHSSCCLHLSGLCTGSFSHLEHCLLLFTVRTSSPPPSIHSLNRCILDFDCAPGTI